MEGLIAQFILSIAEELLAVTQDPHHRYGHAERSAAKPRHLAANGMGYPYAAGFLHRGPPVAALQSK